MGRNKMIAKSCPKCEMQVAVASKSCKCGHTFFASRKAADLIAAAVPEDLRRRTARVRRAQTQFYDQSVLCQQKRRNKKRSDSKSLDDEKYKYNKLETERSPPSVPRRRRALRRAALPPAPPPRRDPEPSRARIRPEQLRRCETALTEINRKMTAVIWRPPPDLPATTSTA